MNILLKKIIFLSILSFGLHSVRKTSAQQNLVLNPSFEQFSDTIYGKHRRNGSLGEAGRVFCDHWIIPGKGSPDMLHGKKANVFGMPAALARTGLGRAGFIAASGPMELPGASYKEYIQGRFLHPLDSGKTYQISFYLALDRGAYHYAENLGALISSDTIRKNDLTGFYAEPQIRYTGRTFSSAMGWIKVCGTYKAEGGEQYITIGSFDTRHRIHLREAGLKAGRKNLRWKRYAYYYLDDVSVTEANAQGSCESYEPGSSRHWIFLLDASASMLSPGRWERMPDAFAKAMSMVEARDRVSLIYFNDSARFAFQQLAPRQINSAEIFKTVNPQGGTEVRNALHLAYRDTLQHDTPTSVVLITDALFPGGKWSESIRKAYLKFQIHFHAITLGESKNQALERLTETCSGFYRNTGQGFTGNELAAVVHRENRSREKVFYGKGQFYKTQAFVMVGLLTALVLIRIV